MKRRVLVKEEGLNNIEQGQNMVKEQKKNKTITFRITESSLDNLRIKSKELCMSINGYINFLINSFLQKKEALIQEKLTRIDQTDARP